MTNHVKNMKLTFSTEYYNVTTCVPGLFDLFGFFVVVFVVVFLVSCLVFI